MVNYGNGLIYKLCCNDTNIKEEYVGSTVDFTERKRCHKKSCNNVNGKIYNLKVYQFIRENGGFENWSMVLIEKYPCNDILELKSRERYFIELLKSRLNCCIPTRTKKEWRNDNKETIKEKDKVYRDEHKETIKERDKVYREEHKETIKEYYEEHKEEILERQNERVVCECGCESSRSNLPRHRQSQKHINLMIVKNNTEIKK